MTFNFHNPFIDLDESTRKSSFLNLATSGLCVSAESLVMPSHLKLNFKNSISYPRLAGERAAITAIESIYQVVSDIPCYDITITNGATQALFAALMRFAWTGNNIITFEPFYPPYMAMMQCLGLEPRFVRLAPPNWSFDLDILLSLFSDHTAAVIVNNPHNPTGKVFSPVELTSIFHECVKRNIPIIADEVYRDLIYGHTEFTSMLNIVDTHIPCVSIGSLSKTFGLPGLRAGWAITNNRDFFSIANTVDLLSMGVCKPAQDGIATLLPYLPQWRTVVRSVLRSRCKHVRKCFARLGARVADSEGSYHTVAYFDHSSDSIACLRDCGVLVMPLNTFYAVSISEVACRISFGTKIEGLSSKLKSLWKSEKSRED